MTRARCLSVAALCLLALGAADARAGDDARIVSHTLPSSLRPGEQRQVSVTVENTGDTTWERTSQNIYKLGAVGDSDPLYGPDPRVWLPAGVRVLPGQRYTFGFTLTAPTAPGTYTTDWRMVHEHVRWFGQAVARQVVVGARDDARIVADTIPALLQPGERRQVSVTVENTGDTTWVHTPQTIYKLGAVGDSDPLYTSDSRVWLPAGAQVPPGQRFTFAFTLTAPAAPGTYTTDWRMVHEWVRWFGEALTRTVEVRGPYVVTPDTLTGKQLMGYQGWFCAQGDGSPVGGWIHWFAGQASVDRLTVEMWPDLSELGPAELHAVPGFSYPSGTPASLYSAYHERTVTRHFEWMRDHDLDGASVQRFTSELRDPRFLALRDEVLRHCRLGAEQAERVFHVMYDISGHDPATVVDDLKRDWMHLVDDLQVTQSPRYLRHRGRPLLGIWGIGFEGRGLTPGPFAALLRWLHHDAPAQYQATVLGGLPTHWRTLSGDSESDTGWAAVYRALDVISPWSVGRYGDDGGADRFARDQIAPDLAEARRVGADYLPVVWPGFSWSNLMRVRGSSGAFNQTPRRGGRFFWRQVYNAKAAGCDMLYTAMFDEVDEGTAMFKLAATQADVPVQGRWLTLDADGERLPSDWYLRLAGEAGRMLRGARPLTATRPLQP